jgi:hypothetical protein
LPRFLPTAALLPLAAALVDAALVLPLVLEAAAPLLPPLLPPPCRQHTIGTRLWYIHDRRSAVVHSQ